MGKFGAIKSVRHGSNSVSADTTVEARPQPILAGRGRPAGKRSNPDFEPTTIFLRKVTKKTANRVLEDRDDRQDLSELIEELLQTWISEHSKI